MRPASPVFHECDEYEKGKPDDLTPLRMAELVKGAIVVAAKPMLLPLTAEEKRLCQEERSEGDYHDPALRAKGRRMYRRGRTLSEIADFLKMPRSTIFGWCHGLKRDGKKK